MPAAASTGQSPIPGYGIQEITWNLETTSGTTVNFTGTIQQVMETAKKQNIDLKQNPNASSSSSIQLAQKGTSSDDDFHAAGQSADACDVWNQSLARVDKIQDGIKYLRGVTGKPSMGPGPGNCGRVSCSWNAAIYWCNDVSTLTSVLRSRAERRYDNGIR